MAGAWTPNPNFQMNTFCSMGMDCSQYYLNKSDEQNTSGNQGQEPSKGEGQSQGQG